MAQSKIRVKEGERLNDEVLLQKVINLIDNWDKSEYKTKKALYEEACKMLNISYNVSRLDKAISDFKQREEDAARRRASNRGKPASKFEIQSCIEAYLDGDSIAEIAKRIYRSPSFVKDVIDRVGVPQRPAGADYWHPILIPDPCVREEFKEGEIVWSAKRHGMAIIRYEEEKRSDLSNRYYKVWIIEPIEEPSPYFPQYQEYGGYYDGAYAYDLASLEHLKEYGVDIYRPYRPYFTKWLEGK